MEQQRERVTFFSGRFVVTTLLIVILIFLYAKV